jgi:hypothetical protein
LSETFLVWFLDLLDTSLSFALLNRALSNFKQRVLFRTADFILLQNQELGGLLKLEATCFAHFNVGCGKRVRPDDL